MLYRVKVWQYPYSRQTTGQSRNFLTALSSDIMVNTENMGKHVVGAIFHP